MRILIALCAGTGHLLPLLPLARAARLRGDDVVIATGASMAEVVDWAGFRHVPMGPATIREVVATFPEIDGFRGRDRADAVQCHAFSGRIAVEMADGVVELATSGGWRPDVIVQDDVEYGSWIAGERLGIPCVTVQVTAWRPRVRRIISEGLNEIRARHGLPPDPDLAGLSGALYFTTRPPSLRDPATPLPNGFLELRPEADDRVEPADGEPVPEWLASASARPRIAVTLGTVNADRLGIFRSILDGLASVAPAVEVVVGLGADPATLGSVGPWVRVERYVPMSLLLPRSEAVICHGGSGTMLAAVAAAVPLIVVPLAADEPENGDACRDAGVGLVIEPEALTADAVRDATERILGDPSFRARASAVAAEIAAMPGPSAAVERIEALAT